MYYLKITLGRFPRWEVGVFTVVCMHWDVKQEGAMDGHIGDGQFGAAASCDEISKTC